MKHFKITYYYEKIINSHPYGIGSPLNNSM